MVHRRQVGDTTLVFGVHGALWGNAMTWWDHDTGSIWSQPTGEAIAGPRTGERVELLPSEFTTWGSWLAAHPETLALDAPGRPTGFDLSQVSLVVDFTDEAKVYPVEALREVGVVNDVVAGLEVAVVSNPTDPQSWAVFSRRVGDDGQLVELEIDGEVLRDRLTGSTFDPERGLPLDGPVDEILDLLPALTSFPGDVDTFWPEAETWQP